MCPVSDSYQRPSAVRLPPLVCTGPIAYVGQEKIRRDIANLKAAMAAAGADEGRFLRAYYDASPRGQDVSRGAPPQRFSAWVELVAQEARVEELVRMLGGGAPTAAARQHARELLRMT